jgi:hypothetical protein
MTHIFDRVSRRARARVRGITLVAAAALLATLVPASGASAAATSTTAGTLCPGTLSQPFAPWSDLNSYTLAPGGSFEGSVTGWSLAGGASVTSGSQTYAGTGVSSLSVPVGSTAVSPDICIDPTRETFRFFARNNSSSSTAKLKVEILYPTKSGGWKSILGGIVDTAKVRGWQVSPIYSNSSDLALLSGLSNPPVRYRFTASGGGWQVDDVYVDPFRRG